MTIRNAAKSNLVVREKEEPPALFSVEEPKKGSDKEKIATSPACNRKDSQAGVPETAEAEAIRSNPAVRKKEESSISLISLSQNSNPYMREEPSVPLPEKRKSTNITGLRDTMRTGYSVPGSDHSMDNHPGGRCSSKKIITDIHRIGKSGQHKHVISRTESECMNSHTMTYKNQEVEMENNQRLPRLTESESESDSDTEDEGITAGNHRCRHDKALRSMTHAPRKALSGTSRRNLDIARNKQALYPDPGSKLTTTNAEACSNPGIDHIKTHYPVGRNSSV